MKLENISEAFVQTSKKTGKGVFFDSRASIGEVFNATPEDVKKAIAKVRKSHEMKRVLDMGYTDVTTDTNIKNGTIHVEKSSGSFKDISAFTLILRKKLSPISSIRAISSLRLVLSSSSIL